MGLETRERLGWCHLGIRAKQFKATSSGSVGIRTDGSRDGGGDSVVDMERRTGESLSVGEI